MCFFMANHGAILTGPYLSPKHDLPQGPFQDFSRWFFVQLDLHPFGPKACKRSMAAFWPDRSTHTGMRLNGGRPGWGVGRRMGRRPFVSFSDFRGLAQKKDLQVILTSHGIIELSFHFLDDWFEMYFPWWCCTLKCQWCEFVGLCWASQCPVRTWRAQTETTATSLQKKVCKHICNHLRIKCFSNCASVRDDHYAWHFYIPDSIKNWTVTAYRCQKWNTGQEAFERLDQHELRRSSNSYGCPWIHEKKRPNSRVNKTLNM